MCVAFLYLFMIDVAFVCLLEGFAAIEGRMAGIGIGIGTMMMIAMMMMMHA